MHSVTGCLRDSEGESDGVKEEVGSEGVWVEADKDGNRERGGSGAEGRMRDGWLTQS